MQHKFIFVTCAFLVALFLSFRIGSHNPPAEIFSKKAIGRTTSIGCSPDWASLSKSLEEFDIPPIPGAGNYQWKISTVSDSAQFYFNQGINTYYSFHIIEAMASFKKAARFDPNCPMLFWAQALAYGPNINDFGYAASPEALTAVQKAMDLIGSASAFEKALINAMAVRYTADSADISRQILNRKYTAAMKKVFEEYQGNADAGTLYADAMMLEHPWDLWFQDGKPKEWTPAIREVLERALSINPGNPGANHYYIHVMEPSPYAAKALPAADRLGDLTPGLSHTIHMPSHIYLRTGHFEKGIKVNESAVGKYKALLPIFAPVGANDFLYVIHNLHMQTNNAMLAGQSVYSSLSATQTVESIKLDYLKIPGAMGNLVQYVYMIPTLVNVRFGNWDKLINAIPPEPGFTYSSILYHFGKGMALANLKRIKEAKVELTKLQNLMQDSVLYLPLTPFSAAIEGSEVAEHLLIGTIALKEQKFRDGIAAFEHAVVTEESMVYNEPRDWLLNPRHYLGNAYLKAKRPAEAIPVFLDDLAVNNENGWALYGLYQAYLMTGRKSNASKTLARYKKAFSSSDIKLHSAVF